jgi:hypothetical protein
VLKTDGSGVLSWSTPSTSSTTVTITDNESTNEGNALVFAADADLDGGTLGLESDGDATYNPSTGTIAATNFSGNLTGTLQTAAQGNVTSLGTLTTLTVDNVITDGTTIGHTDDTDLMTLANGSVTFTGSTVIGTADVNGGAIDGAAIGANSATTGAFTTITASTSLDVTGSAGVILQNDETITNSTDGTVLINGTVAGGTGSAAGVFQSNGDNDVTLQTGNSTTGSITITDGANGNIAIAPNGSGAVQLDGLSWPTADGSANQVLKTDGSGALSWATQSATTVTITDNESTNEGNALIFAADADLDGGTLGLESDGDATYNPSTGTIAATNFSGNLTGTLQTAAQGNVTSLGTLTTLTVDNVITDGTTIGHTDDTDLMTLANGSVTFTGSTVIATADVNGGAIDGAAIGANSATTGAFTTITASTSLDVTGSAGVILQNDETITNSLDGTVLITAPTTSLSGDLTVTGNDITFGNGETISNGTDGTLAITAPATTISGTLTSTGALTASANLTVGNGASTAGSIVFNEDTDDGGNTLTLKPAAMAANVTLTLPVDDGTANQVLATDGDGALSWATQSSTVVTITDNESTNEGNALIFAADADLDGGTLGLESDGDATYNPSTGVIGATGFSGATVVASTSVDITGSTGIILENDETITNSTDGTVLINGTVAGGTGSAVGVFQSNGDNDITIQTGNSTTGSIMITDGANGDIAVAPNGTGKIDFNDSPLTGYGADLQTLSGTSKTLAATDNGTIIVCSSSSSVTITVPASLPSGFNCMVIQSGTGQVSLSASSTTLNNRNGSATAGQYAIMTLVHLGSNVYVVSGDTTS